LRVAVRALSQQELTRAPVAGLEFLALKGGWNGGVLPNYKEIYASIQGGALARSPRPGVKRNKRLSAVQQRTGPKGNAKIHANVVVKSQKTGVKGGGGSPFNSSLRGPDLWREIAQQASVDNEKNVGRLAGRIKYSPGHIVRGREKFNIELLEKELGKNICLAVAVGTSTVAALNVVFCDKVGQQGHEHDGTAHSNLGAWAANFNDQKRGSAFRQRFV